MDRPAKLVAIPPRMRKQYGRGRMLIPSPLDVDALIRRIPRGKLITQTQIRERLASAAGAGCACPMTTAMFVRIAAEAARSGKIRITPYWRVIRDDGALFEKFPGGPSAQAERLENEGHSIERSGKLRVKDPARALVR